MKDDAERARKLAQKIVNDRLDNATKFKGIGHSVFTNEAVVELVAEAIEDGRLAFAQQPEGWRPIEMAKLGQLATFWIASADAEEEGWHKFGYVAETVPLCIRDDEGYTYWPHENGGYATHFQPVLPPPAAMLDVAPIPGEE